VAVICAGALVTPGDAIVADDDGIAVVPFAQIDRVIRAGEERVAREARKRARLANGELGLDIDNMRPRLEELGLRYVDSLDDLD
jgi:4-hydroxy-4-methyl-2-oxoglutarate aldolase